MAFVGQSIKITIVDVFIIIHVTILCVELQIDKYNAYAFRCEGGLQDLQGKHPRRSNIYEIEAYMLPAEYLKQKVRRLESKLSI